MSKLLKATPNDDYTLLVEFEGGNKIIWNMQELAQTIRFLGLHKPDVFKNLKIEDKHIIWPDAPNAMELTVDEMIFTLRR